MKTLTIILLLLLLSMHIQAQSNFRVMSYNIENLFDTTDDPLKDDNEYLPAGVRHWTSGRYYHKLQQIARVINAAGEWNTPALVGLCEVESDSALIHLLNRTPLKQQQYRYCITHSPDRRGINVALLYQRDMFRYIGHTCNTIQYTGKRHKLSRDILHVWGEVITGDTMDVFVCHFPSRYGGEKESEADRIDAARTLSTLCDSLFSIRSTSQIVIMGDFNDTPQNISLSSILSAHPYPDTNSPVYSSSQLYNLFSDPRQLNWQGSHKYQGEWSQLDHIIVNGTLLRPKSAIHIKSGSNRILTLPFLLTKDKTWRGNRPLRSYYGFKYEGGYSDHLPLLVDFLISSLETDPTPAMNPEP